MGSHKPRPSVHDLESKQSAMATAPHRLWLAHSSATYATGVSRGRTEVRRNVGWAGPWVVQGPMACAIPPKLLLDFHRHKSLPSGAETDTLCNVSRFLAWLKTEAFLRIIRIKVAWRFIRTQPKCEAAHGGGSKGCRSTPHMRYRAPPPPASSRGFRSVFPRGPQMAEGVSGNAHCQGRLSVGCRRTPDLETGSIQPPYRCLLQAGLAHLLIP